MRISDWSSECALPISFLGPDAALAGPHEDSQPTPSRCISRHVHRDAGQPALEFPPDDRQLWLLERPDDRSLSVKPGRRSTKATRHAAKSAERREGKGCVVQFRYQRWPYL